MAKRRKVSNLLALAVLTLVTERPMHPYEMATVLRDRGKHRAIDIKWGSLYTVVANLDKHGLIEAAATDRQGRRPERTIYTVTDAGRTELRDWLRELVGVPQKEYRRFEAALSEIAVLPPDEVLELLERRLTELDGQIADQRAELERGLAQVPRLFLIEAEYYLAMCQAEAQWTRGLVAELRHGTFPGLEHWRAFHESGAVPAEIVTPLERGWPD